MVKENLSKEHRMFLYLVKQALSGKTVSCQDSLKVRSWQDIFLLADRHLMLPMVYETVFQTDFYRAAEQNAGTGEAEMFRKVCQSAYGQVTTQYSRTAAFLDLYEYLRGEGLHPLVVKGLICRGTYPLPEYRQSWDEDILIPEEEFAACHEAVVRYGMQLETPEKELSRSYEIIYRDLSTPLYLEVHKTLFPAESKAYGDWNRYFYDVFDHAVETEVFIGERSGAGHGTAAGDIVLTMAPQEHLFYLICHMLKHFMYFGAGMRQLTDILMFAGCYGTEINWDLLWKQCREIHGDIFAASVFSLGEQYLGFDPDAAGIPRGWIREAVDPEILLQDILDAGMQARTSKSRIHSSSITLGAVAAERENGWIDLSGVRRIFPPPGELYPRYPYLEKYPVLLPAAWIQRLVRYGLETRGQGDQNSASEALRIGRERIELFREQGILEQERNSKTETFSRAVKTFGTGILGGRLAPAAGTMWKGVFSAEWVCLDHLWRMQGYRMPGSKEREAVRKNVTFIYKSFERQKMAIELYHNIQKYYPGAQVIIADDSKEPLTYEAPYLEILHLPFNSGLSRGIIQAVERVRTPYLMRMDDDELLTLRSNVGRQLRFLQKNPEADIVTFGFITVLNHHPEKSVWPEYYLQSMTDAPKKLRIRHMTRLDETHTVLGKGPNIYLARTDGIRKVGYDENIRMLDHHEFFTRAAGILVTVGALDSFVFHRHDPFDIKYQKYRADIRADQEYIIEKIRGNKSRADAL